VHIPTARTNITTKTNSPIGYVSQSKGRFVTVIAAAAVLLLLLLLYLYKFDPNCLKLPSARCASVTTAISRGSGVFNTRVLLKDLPN
jgi:hypothetical protein